jgi:outer membrane protein TolC
MLALQQASAYQQALIDEQSAMLDLRQARAALMPRLRSATTVIFNKPLHPGAPDTPSFIAQNAVREYQELFGFEGSLDFGQRAAIARSRALLAAAHAGTEIARRALIRGVRESYYGLALATAKRKSAEQVLAAAQEFERVTTLLDKGGEVPEVDAIRARLQTAQRRDDLENARLQETAIGAGLRVLVGYTPAQELTVADLVSQPSVADLARFTPDLVARRPEIAQSEAQVRAARSEIGVARASRLPSLTYTADQGFDSPSLRPSEIKMHRGYLVTGNLVIPIFDWGIGAAKQRQAELKLQGARNQAVLARRTAEQEFNRAREEAFTAIRRVDNARAALDDAQRNLDISIARYRAGEAPILEVTDAMTTLATQRTNYNQALFDFEIARAHLQEAAGE